MNVEGKIMYYMFFNNHSLICDHLIIIIIFSNYSLNSRLDFDKLIFSLNCF